MTKFFMDKGKRYNFTDEQREQMVVRYEAGETIRELAYSYGCVYSTMHAYLKKANVTFRPKGYKPKETV